MPKRPDLVSWLHPALQVGRSAIHGSGVFTAQELISGTLVIRFGGFMYPARQRYNHRSLAANSIVGISEDVLLAEPQSAELDPSDFLNHSCAPNLGLLDAISLVVIEAVTAGSELTADYGYWELDENYRMGAPCNCQSRNCRRVITGKDWRGRSGHLEHWAAPFIRRRIDQLSQQ